MTAEARLQVILEAGHRAEQLALVLLDKSLDPCLSGGMVRSIADVEQQSLDRLPLIAGNTTSTCTVRVIIAKPLALATPRQAPGKPKLGRPIFPNRKGQP